LSWWAVIIALAALDRPALIRQADGTVVAISIVTTFHVVDTRSGQTIADLPRRTLIITRTSPRFLTAEINAAAQGRTIAVDPTLNILLATASEANLSFGTRTLLIAFIQENTGTVTTDFARLAIVVIGAYARRDASPLFAE
jgi:hypothetical protein